jgi:23S rRNA (adenine2503-C2)-methyltransferase
MTDISKPLRRALASEFPIFSTHVRRRYLSPDRTEKLLIQLSDGYLIESVVIRDGQRCTACISTQVGCPVRCRFCASGLDGFKRNLTPEEMVEQVLHIRLGLGDSETLSNLVIMGIGEPLLNFENLVKVLRIFRADWGVGIGYNKTTLSTIGVRLGYLKELCVQGVTPNLAISLHAPNDKVRAALIPRLKTRVQEIIRAGMEYKAKTRKEVTFEYLLISGINDRQEHALELGEMLRGTRCKLNVIPYNRVYGLRYREPSKQDLDRFVRLVGSCGVAVTVRKRKGDEINAACGQLRFRYLRQ